MSVSGGIMMGVLYLIAGLIVGFFFGSSSVPNNAQAVSTSGFVVADCFSYDPASNTWDRLRNPESVRAALHRPEEKP